MVPPRESASNDGSGHEDDLIDLTPTIAASVGSPGESFRAELVTGDSPSLTTATTPILHSRLRAVTILLLAVYGLVLFWSLIQSSDPAGTMVVFRNASIFRLIM